MTTVVTLVEFRPEAERFLSGQAEPRQVEGRVVRAMLNHYENGADPVLPRELAGLHTRYQIAKYSARRAAGRNIIGDRVLGLRKDRGAAS